MISPRPVLAALAFAALSAAAAQRLEESMSGEEVTAEGVVHSVAILPDGRVAFDVHGESPFTAIFEDASTIAPVDFEDARVAVTGVLEFGDSGDGSAAAQLLAEDVAAVDILDEPPANPFLLPAIDLTAADFKSGGPPPHRVHVQGVVTSSGKGESVFMLYAGGGEEVPVHPAARKAPLPGRGDVVNVCAFVADGGKGLRLEEALVRVSGHDESKLPPYWTAGRVWALMGIVVSALLAVGLAALVLLRRFERERYNATRRERLRLSHDLHDNLQQLLAATMFRLDAAQSLFDCDPKSAKEQLGWAKKSVECTQAGLRGVLWDLQEESEGPDSLSGLIGYAVGRMAHWQGKVAVEVNGREPSTARSLGGRFLMIVQEAVWNALSRGGAKKVRIRLFFRDRFVRLVVSDDGCGFDAGAAPGVGEGHLGLASMRMRAEEIGGSFAVKSEIGRGTSVIVEVPGE